MDDLAGFEVVAARTQPQTVAIGMTFTRSYEIPPGAAEINPGQPGGLPARGTIMPGYYDEGLGCGRRQIGVQYQMTPFLKPRITDTTISQRDGRPVLVAVFLQPRAFDQADTLGSVQEIPGRKLEALRDNRYRGERLHLSHKAEVQSAIQQLGAEAFPGVTGPYAPTPTMVMTRWAPYNFDSLVELRTLYETPTFATEGPGPVGTARLIIGTKGRQIRRRWVQKTTDENGLPGLEELVLMGMDPDGIHEHVVVEGSEHLQEFTVELELHTAFPKGAMPIDALARLYNHANRNAVQLGPIAAAPGQLWFQGATTDEKAYDNIVLAVYRFAYAPNGWANPRHLKNKRVG